VLSIAAQSAVGEDKLLIHSFRTNGFGNVVTWVESWSMGLAFEIRWRR
jgi:hypothetical protein